MLSLHLDHTLQKHREPLLRLNKILSLGEPYEKDECKDLDCLMKCVVSYLLLWITHGTMKVQTCSSNFRNFMKYKVKVCKTIINRDTCINMISNSTFRRIYLTLKPRTLIHTRLHELIKLPYL